MNSKNEETNSKLDEKMLETDEIILQIDRLLVGDIADQIHFRHNVTVELLGNHNARVRLVCLSVLIRRHQADEALKQKVLGMLPAEPDPSVRCLILVFDGKYFRGTWDKQVCWLLANIGLDESEDMDVRRAASRAALSVTSRQFTLFSMFCDLWRNPLKVKIKKRFLRRLLKTSQSEPTYIRESEPDNSEVV